MPKIRAATVAEHRAMQRTALLDAARALLAEGGMDALTFPALAERTGLARSSVYEYFRSRGAVVEELFSLDFPVWAAEIESAMDAAAGALPKVDAYVRSQLAFVRDGRHRAVVAIAAGELDRRTRERIRTEHGRLGEMITEALAELGHERPRLTAGLVQGVVQAAMRSLERIPDGGDDAADAVIEEAVEIALRGAARRG